MNINACPDCGALVLDVDKTRHQHWHLNLSLDIKDLYQAQRTADPKERRAV